MKKLALSLVALMFATSVFAMNFSVGAKGIDVKNKKLPDLKRK